jgi:glutamate 5-kinase
VGVKYGNFDSLEEQVNNILNTNALLILLNKRGLIDSKEFMEAKNEALQEFKKQYPELFEKNNK